MPTAETVAAYAGSIAFAVAIIVQLIKQGLIDPRVPDGAGRDALLRGMAYALNLGGLLGVLALNHQLDGTQILTYVTLALGQSVFSSVGYSTLSKGSAPKPAASTLDSAPANDVKVEAAPITVDAGPAIVPTTPQG
jgi:hypothetical protein